MDMSWNSAIASSNRKLAHTVGLAYQELFDFTHLIRHTRQIHKQAPETSLDTLSCLLITANTLCPSPEDTHTQTTSSLPGTEEWDFHCTRLVFIYRAITQREWNSCTCLSISLFPNKSHLLIKQQTHTSWLSRKLRSDISTHTYQVHFT